MVYLPCAAWALLGALGPLGNSSLALLAMIGALAAGAYRRTLPGKAAAPLSWLLAAFWLSAAFSGHRAVAMAVAFAYTLILLTAWMAASSFWHEERCQTLLFGGITAAGVVAAVWAIVAYTVFNVDRAGAAFIGYTGLGTMSIFTAAIGVGYLQGRRTNLWVPYLVLVVAGLIVTFSRGGWLGFVLMVLLYGMRSKRTLTVALATIAVGSLVLWSVPELRSFMIGRIADFDTGRFGIWQTTWQIIKDNFWLGVGGGVHPFVYNAYRVPGAPADIAFAHNIILGMWADLGLIGLLPFLWLLGLIVWAALRLIVSGSPVERGLGAGLMGVLLHQIFDMPIYGMEIGIFFWTMCAITYARAVTLDAPQAD